MDRDDWVVMGSHRIRRLLIGMTVLLVGVCAACSVDPRLGGITDDEIVGRWGLSDDTRAVIVLDLDGTVDFDGFAAEFACSSDDSVSSLGEDATGHWSMSEDRRSIFIHTDNACFAGLPPGEFYLNDGKLEMRYYEPGVDRDGFPEPLWVFLKN